MIRTDSTSGLWESLFQARAKELVKQLSDPSSVKAVVADSKFYSAGNAENMVLMPFITRVPETIGAVRNLIEKALSCVPDAGKALSKLVREWDFHTMTDHEVEEHRKYAGRGRPKPGAEPTAVEYQIIMSFEQNTQKISREKLMGQCYLLASCYVSIPMT